VPTKLSIRIWCLNSRGREKKGVDPAFGHLSFIREALKSDGLFCLRFIVSGIVIKVTVILTRVRGIVIGLTVIPTELTFDWMI
jgi:hypothetical protein